MAYNFTDKGNMVGKKPRAIYWTELQDAVNDLDSNKVDKVAGKQLSTENYTTTEKNKLAKIASNANNYTHPTTAGNKHIPTGGSVGQILKNTASGTATWQNETIYTHPNHTGDVTSSGDGATTISNGAVTNTKMADMSANRIKGRVSTTGVPQDLTTTQVRSMINVENGANKTIINNTLSSTSTVQALSARQGKQLKDGLDDHKADNGIHKRIATGTFNADNDGTKDVVLGFEPSYIRVITSEYSGSAYVMETSANTSTSFAYIFYSGSSQMVKGEGLIINSNGFSVLSFAPYNNPISYIAIE